ncbi:MAG: YicC family protein [Desulfohalobiaceae bacterium]|nr:YicC family protein [Desulfohalobiaceae bacterium]
MIKSMTGYGACTFENDFCVQSWEIKSVNAKQFGLRWHVPGFLKAREMAWEKLVRDWAARGRVDIELNLQFTDQNLSPLVFDEHLAQSMLSQLQAAARAGNQYFQPDYNRFLSIPSLWQESTVPADDRLEESLEQGLLEVLKTWDQSRIDEGQSLRQDLQSRIARLSDWLTALDALTRDGAQKKFETLKARVATLLEDPALDSSRLYQELALIADKIDVSEELTRLKTHIQTLAQGLEQQTSGGRELDFLLQECFREINTCGNKAQDAEISQVVVKWKNELEKCREQVQNLE